MHWTSEYVTKVWTARVAQGVVHDVSGQHIVAAHSDSTPPVLLYSMRVSRARSS